MEPSYSSMYESCSPSASYHEFNDNKKHRPNFPHVPTAMRRNERERNRVKLVNMGFTVLRQHVPNGAKNKKMSKVETLRSAVDYIKQLQKLLGESQSHELLRTFNRSHENVLMSQCSSGSASSPSSANSTALHHVSPSSASCQLNVTPLCVESTGPSSSSPNSACSLDTSELGSSERSLEGPVEDDLISFTKWFS